MAACVCRSRRPESSLSWGLSREFGQSLLNSGLEGSVEPVLKVGMSGQRSQTILQVGKKVRQSLQIATATIAQGQTTENAEHLECALSRHGLDLVVKGVAVYLAGQAAVADRLPAKGLDPAGKACGRKTPIATAQQRDQVIAEGACHGVLEIDQIELLALHHQVHGIVIAVHRDNRLGQGRVDQRSEEHTSELQSRGHLVCRLLLEKKKKN